MINDIDAKIIAPEEIKLTDNLDKASALTLEVNVHFVDKGNTQSNELEINKNRKSQNKVLHHPKVNPSFQTLFYRLNCSKVD